MKKRVSNLRSRKKKRALSPVMSTVILTSVIVVLLLVAIGFANSFLNARIAENEFASMKQFMQTVGLQTDDVAWIPGRTQTTRYASKYGQVKFQSLALNYSFYFDGSPTINFSYGAGVVLFNMPVRRYSLGDNYFETVFPSSNRFLQNGTSAPVCRVSVVEQLSMVDGDYIRIVVAPIIRYLDSTINDVAYFRLYLPLFVSGPLLQNSQSITLSGKNITRLMVSNVNSVTVKLGFPNGNATGLKSGFFNFDSVEETFTVPSNSVVEIYTGEVIVALGLYA